MSEWRKVTLGDVIELKRGYDLPAADRREGTVPIVSSSGRSGFHDEPKVRGPGVVTGRTGTLGDVYYIDEDFWPLNTSLYVRDFKGNEPRYVAALLTSLALERHESAAAVPGVNRNHLHILSVTVPDSATQRRIASVLTSIDELIENNRQRIVRLEQMAQAVFQEWFVHFRYPGHEDAELVESSLGPIPAGWEIRPVASVAAINRAQRKPEADEVVVYIDISSLGDRSVVPPTAVSGIDAPNRARRVLNSGDIVWSMVRPGRRAHALLVTVGSDWIGSTGLAVITPREVSGSFLFEAVSQQRFSDYLVSKEGGAAYPAVKPVDFSEAPLVLPPASVVGAFDEAVSEMHRAVWVLAQEQRRAAELRDLLLPKLVTGAIDVSHLDLGEQLAVTAT